MVEETKHLKGVHGRGGSYNYEQLSGNNNKAWKEFKEEFEHAPPEEIFKFAGRLCHEYGLSGPVRQLK